MGVPERKAVVGRYFSEVLDHGQAELLREMCTPDVVQRFPGITVTDIETVIARLGQIPTIYSSFVTTVHATIAEGDFVAAHITHKVVVRDGLRTLLGVFPAAGKAITWDAMAFFRFEGDRIAEEWIARDDLAVHLQLGVVSAK